VKGTGVRRKVLNTCSIHKTIESSRTFDFTLNYPATNKKFLFQITTNNFNKREILLPKLWTVKDALEG